MENQQKPVVTFIVPALNEELNLPPLFERLLSIESELGFPVEVLVIDDCSDDGTLAITEQAASVHPQIRSFRKPLPHGIGLGIRSGLEQAKGQIGIVVMADGVDPLEEAVPLFCKKILEEGCHLVLLSRYTTREDSQSIPISYKIPQKVFRFVCSKILGIPLMDTTYAFRAFDIPFVKRLGLTSQGFEISPEVTIKTFYAQGKIGEVPGRQTRRVQGQSKFMFSKVAFGYGRVIVEGIKMRLKRKTRTTKEAISRALGKVG